MMKRILTLLLISFIVTLTLIACGQQNSRSSEPSSSSQSDSSVTSTSHSAQSQATSLTDDSTTVATNWQFDAFTITKIAAEKDDGELELEIHWQNTSAQSASFNDLVKVTVKQNDQVLSPTDTDDTNDVLAHSRTNNIDLSYHLTNTSTPVTVTVTPAGTDTGKTVTLNLQ